MFLTVRLGVGLASASPPSLLYSTLLPAYSPGTGYLRSFARHLPHMATTLTFKPATPLLHPLVPPPSQEFATRNAMPNIFVTPPEEEHGYNPPFYYFDASDAARNSHSTSPDLHALDVALGLHQQTDNRAPTFRRSFGNESQETVVMPRRASMVKLEDMHMDVDEEALEAEDGLPDIRSRRRDRFDAEIVEVVKVRRNEGIMDVGEGRHSSGVKMKKSSTFRARASQALRSIKLNVGGGSSGKASRRVVSDSQPPPQSPAPVPQASTLPIRNSFQAAPTSPRSPSISRRRSLTLSQLFTSFKENQGTRPETPSEEPLSPTSPTLVPSESSSMRPMSPTESFHSHARSQQPSPTFEDYDYDRTPSRASTLGPRTLDVGEKPTLSKRKSFRRRLSVLELQKIFTLGSASTSSQAVRLLDTSPCTSCADGFPSHHHHHKTP